MHTFEMSARAGGLLLRLSTRLQTSVTLEAPAITAGIKDISGFRGYHKMYVGSETKAVGVRGCGQWTTSVVVGFCAMPRWHCGIEISDN